MNRTSATISADELRDTFPTSFPQHGHTWGNWKFDADTLTLNYAPKGHWQYEIDLERCATSAQLLDWVFQIQGKGIFSPKDLADMLEALNDLLRPQANLCSCGQNKRIPDVKKFFADRMSGGSHAE